MIVSISFDVVVFFHFLSLSLPPPSVSPIQSISFDGYIDEQHIKPDSSQSKSHSNRFVIMLNENNISSIDLILLLLVLLSFKRAGTHTQTIRLDHSFADSNFKTTLTFIVQTYIPLILLASASIAASSPLNARD